MSLYKPSSVDVAISRRSRLKAVITSTGKMAPRACQRSPDPQGMFRGMVAFLVPKGVQPRRLQIWKQKLVQMGATVEDSFSKKVTHIFAANSNSLLHQVNHEFLKQFKGNLLLFEWLENCLKLGDKVSEDPYVLKVRIEEGEKSVEELTKMVDSDGRSCKRTRFSLADSEAAGAVGRMNDQEMNDLVRPEDEDTCGAHPGNETLTTEKESNICMRNIMSTADSSTDAPDTSDVKVGASQLSSLYNPLDLNRNITGIFGKLINIYRALGDERRSFSYYKAIPVIEKLPFKIENVDQVKHLPAIGKSMQDHIHEIVTTGKLSKLEHFEQDEKVRTLALFGEVWGIGPATALKLYEKGHRTLEDLKNDDSLTHSQRTGIKYFDDIKKRIPRHEVKEMEMLLKKAGEDILPGVIIVCGGSYRRGKASCGDIDIVITHPDGESHKGFLPKYVQYLKGINFLREDLVFSTHSTEGTDSGVDTYFGLCTYPGREQRHRIDLKVYPRNIYAFGLIAWTGNDVLNRRLRLLAESKGYRLDDTGLFLATQGSAGKRGAKSSTSLSCNTEKEVFDFLGFPWLEPHERNL